MQDIIEKMDEIIAKYKKKKKLNNEEGIKAQTYLEPLLKDSQYREKGYGFMLSLPADISGNAFLKVWLENLEDREVIINSLLKCEDFSGEAGYNRLMELCKLFTLVSLPVAFQFLVVLSEKMTSKGTSRPAKKFVAKFKNCLMRGNDLLKIPIGNYELDSKKITSITTLVIYGLLSSEWDDPKQDNDWKRFYLDWLGQCRSKPFLPLINDIEKETARWPEDLQRYGVEKGLLKTVSNKPENEKTGEGIESKVDIQPVSAKSGMTASSEIATKETAVGDENVAGIKGSDKKAKRADEFDALLYLDRLGQYFTELETKIKKTESELIDYRLEASDQRKKREVSETTLAELEKSLQMSSVKTQNLELELTESRNIASQLKIQLEDMKNKYESEITDLLEMIDNRTIQAVQQLKNRMAQLLRTDYQDFKQIEKDQMTVELGENLRSQIANIFQRFIQEDIKF